jgi:pimeloyl-ACP methyl ester carboxylesterase
MSKQQTALTVRSIETPSGRMSYAEAGSGPVALFVHGVIMNKHLWRRQLAGLSDIRRCIAVDLLAHGDTEIDPKQDVTVTANANMLREVLDALKIAKVDVVGNDSGGGISQIFGSQSRSRADIDADKLRHARQLAAGGVQAFRRDDHRWRSKRHIERHAHR